MIKLEKDKNFINDYLHNKNWLSKDQQVTAVEVPGDGNMNFTLRCLLSDGGSIIIKQSRDFVEKYPQVAAPKNRVLQEAAFYNVTARDNSINSKTPDILQLDEANNILLMEDLGAGSDFTYLYNKGEEISEEALEEVMQFLAHLHINFNADKVKPSISNREMRALNHEHIFKYPYMADNGINLDDIQEGLAAIGSKVKENESLKEAIELLGMQYLADGHTLLHGDYFPGSWLKTAKGIKIIDPEFCFFGPAEFELGVCMAHLYMANQLEVIIQKGLQFYQAKADLNIGLMEQFMAVEILRRILGLAQLPLELSLDEKKSLIDKSIAIIAKTSILESN